MGMRAEGELQDPDDPVRRVPLGHLAQKGLRVVGRHAGFGGEPVDLRPRHRTAERQGPEHRHRQPGSRRAAVQDAPSRVSFAVMSAARE
jgi:hypothetical protein